MHPQGHVSLLMQLQLRTESVSDQVAEREVERGERERGREKHTHSVVAWTKGGVGPKLRT